MPENIRVTLAEYREALLTWAYQNLFTFDMALELGLVVLSLLIASAFSARFKPKLMQVIAHYKLPRPAALLAAKLTGLFLPLVAILILFVADSVTSFAGYDAGLCRVVIKLLLAWVVIRLITQIIANKYMRDAFAFIIWVIAALSIFGVLGPVTQGLSEAGVTFGEFEITALGLIKGLLALAAMLYGSLALSGFIDAHLSQTALNAASRVLIGKITRIFLIACALLIAITTAGVDLSVLAIFTGGIGLGIGFGLQRGFSNMFSGMMLLMDQSIKPGDVIEITDPSGGSTTFGWVTHMGGRHTEIITRDNKSYLIPNEQLITQQVVNWSHGDTLVRLMVSFGVHYNSDPHLVRSVAAQAATTVERVQSDPAPICHITAFGESSIDFSLRFWIRDAEKGVTNVKGAVLLALWDAFKANGIQIPYPHREVFVHSTTAAE